MSAIRFNVFGRIVEVRREAGVHRARLSTDIGTLAEALYRKQGWQPGTLTKHRELPLELPLDQSAGDERRSHRNAHAVLLASPAFATSPP